MTKTCRVCGKEKPLSDFPKHKFMADGYLTKCKECTKKSAEAYRRDGLKQSPRVICTDCRTCEDTGCRHNRRTA